MARSTADLIIQRLQDFLHEQVRDQPSEVYREVLESLQDHCQVSLECLDQEQEELAPEGYHDEPEPRPFVRDGLLYD